jgi:lysophospholipase L1-like esterase
VNARIRVWIVWLTLSCSLAAVQAHAADFTMSVTPNPIRLDQPYSLTWQSKADSCLSDLWGKLPGSGTKAHLFAPWAGELAFVLACGSQKHTLRVTVCKGDDAVCLGIPETKDAEADPAQEADKAPAAATSAATAAAPANGQRLDSPLAPAQAAAAPAKPKWQATATKQDRGPEFDHSPLFTEPNGTRLYITPNVWGANNAGFESQHTWAMSGHEWGVVGVNRNDGAVHAYPSAVCGWKYATAVDYPCNGKSIAETTKAKIGFKWEGPSDCAGGANRVNVLLDTYTHSKPHPQAGDKPTTSIMYQSSIDCDGYYGSHARDGKTLVVGDKTYRYYQFKSDWASANTVEIFVGPCTSDHTICGSKEIVIDHLAVLKALAAKGVLSANEYITSIQAGFELLAGGSYRVRDFWIAFDDQAEGSTSGAATALKNPISRTLAVSATNGDAAHISDGDYNTIFRSRGPVKICWDLSVVADRSALQLNWWNNNTYGFDHSLTGQTGFNNPGSYTLVGVPSKKVYAAVKGNTRKSRSHVFDASADTSICMDVTEVDGSPRNMDVTLQADLWDVSAGNNAVFFVGDSITANAMDHQAFDPLAAVVPYENAGWAGSTTSDWVAKFPEWLQTHAGKFVAITLGTNNGADATKYMQDLQSMVDAGLRAGKTMIVTTPPYASSAEHAHLRSLAAQIAVLQKSRPSVLVGPDFYKYFSEHRKELGEDGLHPNEAGNRAIKRMWLQYLREIVR